MEGLKGANLALKFALELAAVAAYGYWGASVHGTALSALAMVIARLLMILLWGRYAAPRAPLRLPNSSRIPFELGVLLLAAVALGAAGEGLLAVLLAAVVVLNALLMTRFDQS